MELFNHNLTAFNNVKEMLKEEDKCCIIQATGTGKTYVALSLIKDIVDQNTSAVIEYVTPNNSIISEVKRVINDEDLCYLLDNIKFTTYHAMAASSEKNNHDLLILDEYHHLGQNAPVWKSAVESKIKNNDGGKVFGMSATPIREARTRSEEDVSKTVFDGNVANVYNLVDALLDGVLPIPKYISSVVCLLEETEELEKKVDKLQIEELKKKNLLIKLSEIKESILKEENIDVNNVLNDNILEEGKYIYFCQPGTNLEKVEEELINILSKKKSIDLSITKIHSDYSNEENKRVLDDFICSKKDKCRIILSVNMLNEGTHIKGIDGVILGRFTKSQQIFYQQIGRALSVSIDSNDNPLIIDLVGNIRNMQSLMNDYQILQEKKIIHSKNIEEQESLNDLFTIKLGIENIIIELENVIKITSKIEYESKKEEVYNYIKCNDRLPNSNDIFKDNSRVLDWLNRNKNNIELEAETSQSSKLLMDEIIRVRAYYFKTPEETYLLKLEEAYDIIFANDNIKKYLVDDLFFKDNTDVKYFLRKYIDEIKKQDIPQTKKLYQLITNMDINFFKTNDEILESRIDQTIQLIEKIKKVPSSRDENFKFDDGASINGFVKMLKHRNINHDLDCVKKIFKVIEKYNSEYGYSRDELIQMRMEAIYEFFIENQDLVIKYSSNYELSSGLKIMPFLIRKKDLILHNDGKIFKKIKELLEVRSPYLFYSEEEILEIKSIEITKIIERIKEVPAETNTEHLLLNGNKVGIFIRVHKDKIYNSNKKGIEELASTILKYNPYYFSTADECFFQKIEELKELILSTGRIPIQCEDEALFKDGTRMGRFVKSNIKKMEEHKDNINVIELKEILENINPYYLKSKEDVEIMRLEYIYNLLNDLKIILPTDNREYKFPDGIVVSTFLHKRKRTLYVNRDSNDIYINLFNLLSSIDSTYFKRVKALEEAKNNIKGIFEEETKKDSTSIKSR